MNEIDQQDLDRAYERAEAQRAFIDQARFISAAYLTSRICQTKAGLALKKELTALCGEVAKTRAPAMTRRFNPWSPTTDPLPPPAKWTPRTSGRPPADGVLPMAEAPTAPGRYVVKLAGAYRLSLMDYFGPQAAERMEADHRAGVSFYRKWKR